MCFLLHYNFLNSPPSLFDQVISVGKKLESRALFETYKNPTRELLTFISWQQKSINITTYIPWRNMYLLYPNEF